MELDEFDRNEDMVRETSLKAIKFFARKRMTQWKKIKFPFFVTM
jgi:hypothetical protein